METELCERIVALRVAVVCLAKLLEVRGALRSGEMKAILNEFSDDSRPGLKEEIRLMTDAIEADLGWKPPLGWTPALIIGGKN